MKNAGNLNEKCRKFECNCRILKFKFKYLNEKSIKRQLKSSNLHSKMQDFQRKMKENVYMDLVVVFSNCQCTNNLII